MPTWPGFAGCAGRILSSDRRLPRCPSPASRLAEPENAGTAPHGQGEGQGEWSVSVSSNWRITFEERGGGIERLKLENCH